MAVKKKKTTIISKYQGQPRKKKDGTVTDPIYYLRNPAGAIHDCSQSHIQDRLKDARFDLATDEEIERYLDSTKQVHDKPIGKKWDPSPDIVVNLPEPAVVEDEEVPATPSARELAYNSGVDLHEVTPTGSNDQILKKDVEKSISSLEE